MELIVNLIKKYHVALDTVKEFEEIILSDHSVNAVKPANCLLIKSSTFIWKIWNKLCAKLKFQVKFNWKKKMVYKKQLFVVLMGTNFSQ